MITYIKLDTDTDEVLVTFVSDAVHEDTKMTKDEFIKYVNGDK